MEKVIRNKAEKGYHKLLVWQRARELVLLVYKHTENFPKSEEFGLKSQSRRSSVSVVLTIVEGHRKRSRKEFLHYLDMGFSSLAELEAALELSLDLNFLSEQAYEELELKRAEVAYLLNALIISLDQPRQ
jgi:four helix bundle protein